MRLFYIIGSIGDLSKTISFDLDLPEEVLDIVMYYLDEEDLNNLTSEEIGSERIKNRANRALERLKMLEGKQFNNTKISFFHLPKFEFFVTLLL